MKSNSNLMDRKSSTKQVQLLKYKTNIILIMTIAIYLAHLNPVTNAHTEIIKDLAKEDERSGHAS